MENEGQETKLNSILNERILRRLQTLVDVVYALVLFQLFVLLPKPTKEMIQNDSLGLWWSEGWPDIITVVIGIVWIIIYWGQNNTQFGHLKAADKTLASMSIVQLFFLMLFLYFIKLDNETDADVLAIFSQSVCLAFAGFLGIWFWTYAAKRGFLLSEVTESKARKIRFGFYPEALTALITIPLAFTDVLWYTLGWLMVIPLGAYFKKKSK